MKRFLGLAFVLGACAASAGGTGHAPTEAADGGAAGAGGDATNGGEGEQGGEPGQEPSFPGVVEHQGPLATGALWSRAWGGKADCDVRAVVVADDGSVYAAGLFRGEVDFDPGSPEELRASDVNTSGFLLRLAAEGDLEWVSTWGAHDASSRVEWGNRAYAMTLSAGGVVVGGQASGSLRWDPAAKVDVPPTSEGFRPVVMSYSASGDLDWVRAWSMRRGRIGSVSDDGTGLVVSGQYDTPFAFGPDALSPEGEFDCFLGRLSREGIEEWGTAWGGPWTEYFCTSSVGERVAVTGTFDWPVDFGDGPELGVLTARTGDAFLLETELDGTRRFARSWGGYGFDNGVAVAALSDGYVVAGEYYGDIDFGSVAWPQARGVPSVFLVRVDAEGEVLWTRTFEPSPGAAGRVRVAQLVANGDLLLLSGGFAGEVDVGATTLRSDDQESASAFDGFVVALDRDGDVKWARSLPAAGHDVIYGLGFDRSRSEPAIVVGGHFAGVADLSFGDDADVWSSPGFDACFVAKLPAAP